jgi:hypothetical protein
MFDNGKNPTGSKFILIGCSFATDDSEVRP